MKRETLREEISQGPSLDLAAIHSLEGQVGSIRGWMILSPGIPKKTYYWLSGSIANGGAVLAAQAMGADLAYIGSAFIATDEANADQRYKEMITQSSADDIVYTNLFTGVHGNYLKGSIEAQGLDPNNLEVSDSSKMNFSSGASKPKSWKEIWGSGQGISAVKSILPTSDLVKRINDEYIEAKNKLI